LRLSNITPGERYDGRCFAGAFRRRAQCFGVRIRVLLVLFAWHRSDLNKRVLVMVVLPMALVTVPTLATWNVKVYFTFSMSGSSQLLSKYASNGPYNRK
jgi:hypothetical protein